MIKKTLSRLRTPLGFLISALLVYLVLFKPQTRGLFSGDVSLTNALFSHPRMQWSDLAQAWEMLIPGYALIGITILTASLFLRAWRWQLIMSKGGKVPYWTVFHALNLGYLLNNVLPLRAGEVLRAVIVARRGKRSVGGTITTVVVERLFDLAAVVVLFGVVMVAFPFPNWLRAAGGALALVTIGALVVGYLLSSQSENLENWLKRRFPDPNTTPAKIASKTVHVIEGFSVLRSRTALFHVSWSTMVLMLQYVLVMKIVLESFQMLDGTYPELASHGAWVQSAVITVITSLGFAIPSAPGGIGTYHAAVLLALSWFGVSQGLAVVFAATIHAVNYVTLNIAGLIGLWRMKLKWSDVVATAKRESMLQENGEEIPPSPEELPRP